MRKWIFAALMVALFVGQALAGPVSRQVIDTTLDDDPTSITGSWDVSGWTQVAVYVDYDETEVGETLSAAVTIDVSYDGTTYLDHTYYDVAGGATLQTTETISADGSYVLWVPDTMPAKLLRVSIVGTDTDSDDTIDVDAFITGVQ